MSTFKYNHNKFKKVWTVFAFIKTHRSLKVLIMKMLNKRKKDKFSKNRLFRNVFKLINIL